MWIFSYFQTGMAFTDQEIVHAIRDGSGKPDPYLEYLYRQNRGAVLSYVMKNQGDRTAGLEILHLGIIKAYEAIQDGRYQFGGTLNRYILTICRNTWINRARGSRRTAGLGPVQTEGLADDSRDAYDWLRSEDNRRLCNQLLGQLGEACKQILLWSEGEERPMKWIARTLGYASPQVAMNKKTRCKKKLLTMVRKKPEYMKLINEIVLN